jgi:hypothetical protein
MTSMRCVLAVLFLGLSLVLESRAGDTVVDLELVLAVDASGSVDDDEYALQVSGIAAGFRDPDVRKAIRSGPSKAIAVNLLVWAEPRVPKDMTGFLIIASDADAESFAKLAEAFPRRQTGATAIGEGIAGALRSLDANGIEASRQVVDVSGDGRESVAREFIVLVDQARAMAILRGVVINGLAIENEVSDLADYYRRNIQTGPDSFVMAAKSYEDFAEAMRLKLLREIEYRPRITSIGCEHEYAGKSIEPTAIGHLAFDGGQDDIALAVGEAERQDFRHEFADLARREIDDRGHLPSDEFVQRVIFGDLRGGPLDPKFGTEVDLQLERGLARFRKGLGSDDGSGSDVDLEEIVEGDRCWLVSRLCHGPVLLRMTALP